MMFWRSRQLGEISLRRIHKIVPILLFLASASTFAEPREPFVIAIEGESAEAATATEAQTVYGDPPVPLVRNVTSPTLTAFLPDPAEATGTAVIVAPGGAYIMLAIEHEGTEVASWLADHGVAAFVLKYRTAPMPQSDAGFKAMRDRQMREPELLGPIIEAQAPIAIADGRAAVKLLRSRAAEWNLDPHRIGMLGFSAGGGVATGTATQYEAGERPDFAALIYGAGVPGTIPDDAPPLFNPCRRGRSGRPCHAQQGPLFALAGGRPFRGTAPLFEGRPRLRHARAGIAERSLDRDVSCVVGSAGLSGTHNPVVATCR